MVPLEKRLKQVSVKNQSGLGTFRHNQAYTGIIQAYSELMCKHGIFKTEVYAELIHIQKEHTQWYIQNTDIFKILRIYRTLSSIYYEALFNGYKYFHK